MLIMRLLISLALTLFLSACENRNSHIEALEDYRQRIHNILDLERELEPFQAFGFPKKRELKMSTPPVKISWREFFDLTECHQLQQIIAQRNNQLGKNMEAATQLLYEINLLNAFYQCKQQNAIFSEQQLQAFNIKKSELPLNIWNNTWASSYWQQAFSHQTSHQATEKAQVTELLSGFRALRQMFKLDREVNSDEWYKRYQLIERNTGVLGSLSIELQNHIALLNQINTELRDSKEGVCVANRKSKKFDYLWNVLNKFYLADIQKRQAEMISMAEDLALELAEWNDYFPESAQFREWYENSFQQDSDSNLTSLLKYEIKQHVLIWQELQVLCK